MTGIPYLIPFVIPKGGGPLDALTPAEQHQLLADVAEIRAQLGPSLPTWPSLGTNAKGQELTLRDAFGVMKADVATLKNEVRRVIPFCFGIVAGAVLVAVVVTVGSWVACELMDGRSDAPF